MIISIIFFLVVQDISIGHPVTRSLTHWSTDFGRDLVTQLTIPDKLRNWNHDTLLLGAILLIGMKYEL